MPGRTGGVEIPPFLTTDSGAFLRNPRGGVEDIAEMVGAGMRWLTVNVGDGLSWNDWQIVRDRAAPLGCDVLPWKRCRSSEDCLELLDVADLFGCERVILNIEDEFKDVLPPSKVATLLANDPYAGEVGISTVGWVYNAVDYEPLADFPVLLQLFPTDMRRDPAELEQIQKDCVLHARDKGFTYVGVTFQTYAGAQPSWYAYCKGTRSYYTGDDIGGGQWAPWSVS